MVKPGGYQHRPCQQGDGFFLFIQIDHRLVFFQEIGVIPEGFHVHDRDIGQCFGIIFIDRFSCCEAFIKHIPYRYMTVIHHPVHGLFIYLSVDIAWFHLYFDVEAAQAARYFPDGSPGKNSDAFV